jgi:hypothetical protein
MQKTARERMGQVLDWSSRHILYPQGTTLRTLALSERDPRAYWNYLRLSQAANVALAPAGRRRPVRPVKPRRELADWSVSLGAAGTAPSMFPAKFSFDVNAAPDCTNDYVVYAINTTPSATQANIAAFNNLYSGSAGGTGICGAGSATPYWAYQVSNVALPTSPILSLDGTKVAFVDGANPAVFHVLTWTASQGTVSAPATPTQIVDVTLTGATTDSLSPPFMDYYGDAAYVGSDNGRVFKITGVFKGTPALAGSPWPRKAFLGTPGILTGPVIDFSTGEIFVGSSDGNLYGFTKGGAEFFPLTIGSGGTFGGIVDGPIVDAVNGLIYVGTGEDSTVSNAVIAQVSSASFSVLQTTPIGNHGVVSIHAGAFNNAYFNSSTNGLPITIGTSPVGAREAGTTVTITTTTAHGFVVGENVTVAGVGVAGYNGTWTVVSVPTTTTFTYTDTTSGLANSGGGLVASGSTEWFFYACGVASGGTTNPVLYRVGFNASRTMNATADGTTVSLSANNGEACSPLTEFYNSVDRLFLGLLTSAQVEFFDISTSLTPALGGTGGVAPVAEPGGTSGIIVDNVSMANQASSIYFSTLATSASCGTNFCAVKLTQGGLQ